MFKKLLVLVSLLAVFVFPVHAFAKIMTQEQGMITIGKGETVDDDLFIGSESVAIDGNVLGSVFVGTSKINLTGSIKGDLIAGSGNALLSGNIGGDLYLGAGDVILNKLNVAGNVVIGAGNVTIDKDSKIGGSLIVGAGNLHNYASVGRNLLVGGGSVFQDSQVGKEAHLGGGEIELGPNSRIAGDLMYALGEENSTLKQSPEASIGGTVRRYIPPVDTRTKEDFGKAGIMARNSWLLISFIGSLLIGFLLLKLFPKTSLGLATEVKPNLLKNIGTGFLIIILAGPVLLVLALTVIGLPLAGLLILLLCIELHLAKLVTSYALGRFITQQFSWNKLGVYAVFFLGLAIFYLLRAVPAFGWVITFLFTWTGLGAIWHYTRLHLKSL
jgi:carbonic anhydrase/acetyltransferase-like protein (isoleucine patch superfamily)